jgi:hypothetical protein
VCSLKPRTVMSSTMRARNGLTGRWEGSEVIRVSFLKPKVAGPSMLAIGRPDRHALPRITSSKMRRPRRALPPARAGSFFGAELPVCDVRALITIVGKADPGQTVLLRAF